LIDTLPGEQLHHAVGRDSPTPDEAVSKTLTSETKQA
jgi:hypothetical protein